MAESANGAQPPRAAAFFDLDKTLMAGSSGVFFARAAYESGMISRSRLVKDLYENIRFRLLGSTDDRADDVRRRVGEMIAGVRVRDLERLSPRVLSGVLPRLYPQMLERAYAHQDAGVPVYILTAASQEMADLLARVLAFDGGLGTRSEIVDGRYTGRPAGPFNYREGKVISMQEVAEREGIDLGASFAYSDSESDLPMLRAVGQAVVVNPDAPLRRIAIEEGWEIVELDRLGRRLKMLVAVGDRHGARLGRARADRAQRRAEDRGTARPARSRSVSSARVLACWRAPAAAAHPPRRGARAAERLRASGRPQAIEYACRGGRCRPRRPCAHGVSAPRRAVPVNSPQIAAMSTDASSQSKIRVVVAKPGLDGHDRGAKIIARALRDAGMEVIYTGLHQTPEQIVETVIQEDADAVGLSILSGAHMTLVPRVVELLREQGIDDVVITVGGTIPAEDIPELKSLGVAEVFTPGAPTQAIVDFIRSAAGTEPGGLGQRASSA